MIEWAAGYWAPAKQAIPSPRGAAPAHPPLLRNPCARGIRTSMCSTCAHGIRTSCPAEGEGEGRAVRASGQSPVGQLASWPA
jgi:hypothetical protein